MLLVIAAAGLCALAASIVMARAADRSALLNMAIGACLGIVVLILAVLIALLMTRAHLPQ